jgi:hypothetical protein
MDDILRWWFFCRFVLISANYHIEMISFIKFFPVIRFFLLQRRLGEVSCLCCLIKLLLNFKLLTDCFVDLCWVLFLWRRRVVFSLVYFSSLLLRWLLFLRCFCIARHLAAEFWTRLAAFSVYVFFAIGGWITSWIGAAFLVNFCNMLFPSDSDD